MSLFDDEEMTIGICKVGGPLVLFICVPVIMWITWQVFYRDFVAGKTIEAKNVLSMFAIISVGIIFGVWMCRKGYGWFGGNDGDNS
jgi:hypothetical protein